MKGKKAILSILFLAAGIEIFFIVNTPNFNPALFLGIPYNPFVIYFLITLLVIMGVYFLND